MSEDEEWENLSIETRWNHDKFKARKSAYDEMISIIESGNATRLPITDDLKSAASDSNMIALESGIKVVQSTLSALNDSQLKLAAAIGEAVTEPLATKGLNASKPSVKKLAQETILTVVTKGDPAAVVTILLSVLEGTKAPKLIASVLQVLATIFKEFGSPVADPRPVLKALPSVFANTDKNVRIAASNLATSLSRWVGEAAMLDCLANLKPVQINELKQSFASIDRSARPSRLTRNQELQIERAEADSQSANAARSTKSTGACASSEQGYLANQPQEQDIDPWEYAEPHSVLDKISPDFWDLVKSPKWKEREEALKSVTLILENPLKMQPNGNYSQLITLLLGVARNDATHMCSSLAIQGLTALASGLRKGFSTHTRATIEMIYERFRDKKQIDVITKCFDTLFFHVLDKQYSPILDIVWELGPKHKTALVRLESIKYCVHLLCESSSLLKLSDYERLADQSVKLLGDSQEPMRAAAATMLAALSKIVGPARINKSLSSLDEHKRKRVNDLMTSITVKPRPKPNAPHETNTSGGDSNTLSRTCARGANNPATSNSARRPDQPLRVTNVGSQQGPGKAPPSLAASRANRPGLAIPQTRIRKPGLLSDNMPTNTSIDNSVLDESFESRESRPSISSTPKMVKRSLANAEFTPARGLDAFRRRVISPTKSEDEAQSKSIKEYTDKIAKLTSEIQLEKCLRTEAENRLAKVQVEKDHQILRLKEELSIAMLQLRTQKLEMESYMKTMERCWLRGSSSGDDVGSRLSEMSISSDKPRSSINRTPIINPVPSTNLPANQTTSTANSNNLTAASRYSNSQPRAGEGIDMNSSPSHPLVQHPPSSRIVPISYTSQPPQKSVQSYNATTGQEDLDRAVLMTQNLKQRVEQLKRQKQRSIP